MGDNFDWSNLSLSGRTALVTGGSGGIGAKTALILGRRGANVAVHYHTNKEKADAVCAEIIATGGQSMTVGGGLTDQVAVNDIVRQVQNEFGSIDILINNAGGNIYRKAFLDCSEEIWKEVIALNLFSPVLCAKTVLPKMIEKRWGRIINLSSTGARVGGGNGGTIPYASAKGAIETFTRGLAYEVAKLGITVNAVAPGPTNTPLYDKYPEQLQQLTKLIPMGRVGEPSEVGELIAFLASGAASYITGTVVTISGGR